MISRTLVVLLVLISPPIRVANAGTDPAGSCQERATDGAGVNRSFLGFLQDFQLKTQWSVMPEDLKSAHCLHLKPLTDAEMTSWIQNVRASDPKRESKVIHGISFQNESPKLLELFEDLTRYLPSDRSSSVPKACTQVDCAASALFGAPESRRLLYMLGRYGRNGSQYAYGNADPWTPKELDVVLMTLADVPPNLLPQSQNRQLTHFKRGNTIPGGDTTVSDPLEVFDLWSDYNQDLERIALAHEVWHSFAHLKLDESAEWYKLSGWTEEPPSFNQGVNWNAGHPGTIPSSYGETNPTEDFAETANAYRYAPEKLKAISPEKYEFMKNLVFDGIEFTSEKACSAAPSSQAVISGLPELAATPAGEALRAETFRECGSQFLIDLDHAISNQTKLTPSAETLDCMSSHFARAALTEDLKSRFPAYANLAKDSPVINQLVQVPDEATARLAKQAEAHLREDIGAMLARQETTRAHELKDLSSLDKDRYCAFWGRSPNAFATELGADFDPATNPNLRSLAFKHDATLSQIAKKLCMDLDARSATAMTPERMNAALKEAF